MFLVQHFGSFGPNQYDYEVIYSIGLGLILKDCKSNKNLDGTEPAFIVLLANFQPNLSYSACAKTTIVWWKMQI